MNPSVLVLGSGANKGIVQLGILSSLKFFDNKKIKLYVGSSAGALICYFLMIGYSAEELYDKLKPILLFRLSNMIEIAINLKSQLDSIISQNSNKENDFHLFNVDYLKHVINSLTREKLGIDASDITLNDLCEITQKDIAIAVCNYTDSVTKFFTKDDQITCLEALVMSCSAPILFPPVSYCGKIYIDGGIVSNFPLNYAISHSDKEDHILGIAIRGKNDANVINYAIGLNDVTANVIESMQIPIEEREMICESEPNETPKFTCYNFRNSVVITAWRNDGGFSNLTSKEDLYNDGVTISKNIEKYIDLVSCFINLIKESMKK